MNSKHRNKPHQKEKESRSFLANTATSLVKLGLTAGTVVGAVAGTRALLKNSSTANKWLNNTSKFLSQKGSEVGAYGKAFNQTVTESGWTRFMTGQAQGSFKSNLMQEYKSVALQKVTGMGGKATLFEKAMMSTKEALDNAHNLSVDNIRIDMMRKAASGLKDVSEENNFMLAFLKDRTRAKRLSLDTMTHTRDDIGQSIDTINDSLKAQGIEVSGFEDQINEFAKSVHENLFKSRKEFVKDNVDTINQALVDHKKGIYQELYKKLEKTDSLTSLGLRKLGAKKFTIGEFLESQALEARSELLPKESFKHHAEDFVDFSKKIFEDMDEVLKDQKGRNIQNFGIDTSIFKDLNGKMLDMRFVGNTKDDVLSSLAENIKVPFIGIRPFQTLSLFNRQSPVNNALFSVFKSGTQMSTIEGQILSDDYYLFGNKLFNSKGSIARESVTAIPNRGASARAYSAMTGASRHVEDDDRNAILKTLGLGRQEENSIIDKWKAYLGKDKDINNPYTLMTELKNIEIKQTDEAVEGIYGFVNKFMNTQTKAADYDAFSAYANKALVKLSEAHPSGNVSKATEQLQLALKGFDKENLASILDTMEQSGSKNFDYKKILARYYNDPLEYDIKQHTRDVQIELMQNVANAIGPNGRPADIINELYNTKGIGLLGSNQLMDLDALYKLRASANFKNGMPEFNTKSYEDLRNLFTRKDETAFKTMERMASEVDNIFTQGHLPQKENAFKGNSHILIGQHRSLISGINEGIKEGKGFFNTMSDISDNGVFNQLWAGRKDMSKVTEATVAPYFYLYRLNEGMGWGNLGLGVEDLGSVGSIAKNMFLKRFLAPAAIITGATYLDYESGNLLGQEPSDLAAKAYYGTRLNVQAIKEVTGINAWSRNLQRMMPGINHTLGNPFGMTLDALTFGAIGEDRGYEDYKFNLEKGSDPVRKGRFWSFGSDTPFYGGRIEGYEVPTYRKIIGEPENTDVLYGSEANKWAHSWLPNPRNPLGTLRNLIDPYWLENMHMKDRPYPAMGGIPELEAIPLVGPLLSGTIGNIIKPPRVRGDLKQAYSEYIKDINEKIKSSAPQEGGGYISIAPGGRITDVNIGNDEYSSGGDLDGGNNYSLSPGEESAYLQEEPNSEFSNGSSYVDIYGKGRNIRSGYSVRSNLSAMNRTIIDKAFIQRKGMYTLDDLRDPNIDDALDIAMDPNSMAARLSDTYYSMTEVGGIYGFLSNSVFGEMKPDMKLANSSKMASWSRAWWDKRMGGLGSEISEIGRRFLPNNRNSITDFNPYKNQMPDWMPNASYMLDFTHGDPYTKVFQGESRLPGSGYEATHKLHSDPFFGRYGALDRMNILGDVAPWSEQYKYYSKVVSALHANRYLSDEDYEEAEYTREVVRERKKPFEVYEYKFKYADQILKRNVTIENVIDDITFTTSEMPGTPIRLAGISLSRKDTEAGIAEREYLQTILKPGARITIGTNEDPLNQIQRDTLGTIRAAVYNGWGDPIQKRLVALGAEGKYNKSDAATVNSLFSSSEIMMGKIWEGVSHLDTPLNTKFLQVRSPLEHYKRTFLYGKEFKSWTDPVKDWIVPTVENAATWNPLGATIFGGVIGSLFGTGKNAKNAKIVGAAIGAMTTGLPSSIRVFDELLHRATGDSQYTYIPQRRKKEREVEEYFDKLKYLKYMGLYQKARRLARQEEGVDVEKIVQFSKGKSRVPKQIKQKLKSIKKWIKLGMQENSGIDKEEGKEKLDIINQALQDAEGESLVAKIGPQTQLALKYRQEAESTLYGADPSGDLLTIFRAMPKKERQMMKYFMTAPPEEREEILRLVPKNQRRFYQSKWGLPVDKEPTLQSYFSNHFLPGPDWSGWRSDTSLQGVKLKVIKKEGLDARDMGFFAEDERAAADSPEISMDDIAPLRAINPQSLNDVLRGSGLRNADVRLTTSYTEDPNDTFSIDFDLLHDRRKDIKRAVNDNIHNLI